MPQQDAKLFWLIVMIGMLLSFPAKAFTPTLHLIGYNAEGKSVDIQLERDRLESLPQSELTTHLPWFEGPSSFTGVRLKTLLEHFSLVHPRIKLSALNNYATDMTLDYIKQYDPLIALKQNGHYLKVRDYGPYWIVISIDEHPETAEMKHLAKMVWQLSRIETY